MVATQFNIFDAVVLGVLAISTLIAFFRGFVREVLSLFAWVGAAMATLYLFPYSVAFLKSHTKMSETVAAGAAGLGTYLVALIAFLILASIIGRYVKSSAEVGFLDNVLGLLFGFARGVFVVSLAYLMLSVTLPEDKNAYPDWLQNAKTLSYVEQGGNYLKVAAPEYIADMRKEAQGAKERAQDENARMSEEVRHEVETSHTSGSYTGNPNMPGITLESLQNELKKQERR